MEPLVSQTRPDRFQYQKLDLRGSGFRVVRLVKGSGFMIECKLIHATLDDNVIPYEAVSYTWGTLEKKKIIHINGKILAVTSNLWHILYDLRNPDLDRYLWVDAICINQDDLFERGHQVQRMKHIYQSAESGIFYLSPFTNITRAIMDSLASLQILVAGTHWAADDEQWNPAWQQVHARLRTEYDDLRSKQEQGLRYLLDCSFFRRVWILQEVASVRRASVYCGTRFISAHIFAMAPQLVQLNENSHISAVLGLMRRFLDTTTSSFQMSLGSLLRKFGSSEASDERDRIYALLGLCETKALTPDYTLPAIVIIRHALVHIYGPQTPRFLPHIGSVDALVAYLRRSASDELKYLWSKGRDETLFDYIAGLEPPLNIGDKWDTRVLAILILSSRWPMEVLHKYRACLDRQFSVIPHRLVWLAMGSKWCTDILKFLCQNARHVIIDADASFLLKTRHTKLLKALIEPYKDKAKVIIKVTMKGLWVLFLLVPDDDINALLPLLEGVETRAKSVLIYLRAAARKSPRSFRSRDAILLLWRLTGNAASRNDNNSMSINAIDHLNSQYGLIYNGIRMGGEHEEAADLTSSMLRHHFSGRPIQLAPGLDLSSIGKWRVDVSKSIHYKGLQGGSDISRYN
ncbi:heterokaryon incompatibility protein-domain-containing protein [Xylaria telfairii]|nr:heterokaryon incompatibility protein-domain-containing protein [Xylaria telfairii]